MENPTVIEQVVEERKESEKSRQSKEIRSLDIDQVKVLNKESAK